MTYNSTKDMFYNALCGYYWALMNIMELEAKYGNNQWHLHFVAEVTIQNALADVGHFAARALAHPSNLPFRPCKQLELPAEVHFGEVKKPVRGMPKYKDMILGGLRTYC